MPSLRQIGHVAALALIICVPGEPIQETVCRDLRAKLDTAIEITTRRAAPKPKDGSLENP
mgnify:CR=1 FL=1